MTPQNKYDSSLDQSQGSTDSFAPEEETGTEGGEWSKSRAGVPHGAGRQRGALQFQAAAPSVGLGNQGLMVLINPLTFYFPGSQTFKFPSFNLYTGTQLVGERAGV